MAMSSLRQFILAGILIAALLFSAGCTQQPGETVKPESNTGTHTLTPAGTACRSGSGNNSGTGVLGVVEEGQT